MAKTRKCTEGLPAPMVDILRRLGGNLAVARKRRRMRQKDAAELAGCTRQTIARIEAGDPAVSMGAWMNLVWVLQLSGEFIGLCSPERDVLGLGLDAESRARLHRVREKREKELDF